MLNRADGRDAPVELTGVHETERAAATEGRPRLIPTVGTACMPEDRVSADDVISDPWMVSLFKLTDIPIQQSLLELLNKVEDLVAVGRLIGDRPYIAVETMGNAQETAASQLVMAVDPNARMVSTAWRHEAAGP